MPNLGTNLGLSLYAGNQGMEDQIRRKLQMDQLAQFDAALQQQRADNMARAQAANYLQTLAAQPSAPTGVSKSADAMSTGKDNAEQPAPMSLGGLMDYLKGQGVTGIDAYNAAQQFMPFLSAEDQQELKHQQYALQVQKQLMDLGFKEDEAKQKAGELAERKRHDLAIEKDRARVGAARDEISGWDKKAQQLTTGAQALAEKRDNILNAAKNDGRQLTPDEKKAIADYNDRIQRVKKGLEAIRSKQADLRGVTDNLMPDDSGGQ